MTRLATERRTHARLAVVPNRTALVWGSTSSDDGRESRFLDISRGGAALESWDSPPTGQMVWLRMQSPSPTSWITATIVRSGHGALGVRFEGGCPDELMMAATMGISVLF